MLRKLKGKSLGLLVELRFDLTKSSEQKIFINSFDLALVIDFFSRNGSKDYIPA